MLVIRGEDNSPAVQEKRRRKTCSTEPTDLMALGAVGPHDIQVHLRGLDEVASQKRLVARDLLRGLWMMCPVDNPLPIRRNERPAIVTQLPREPSRATAVCIHGVDFQGAVAAGSEDDLFSVGRKRGFGVVARPSGELFQNLAA